MVLECVRPFFEKPQWLEPVCEYFRSMGYTASLSGGSRPRIIWPRSARGESLRPPGMTIGTWSPDRSRSCSRERPRPSTPLWDLRALWWPHPPLDSPLYFKEAQIKFYFLGQYLKNSWPWREYTRVLSEDSVLPTILTSYGRAAEIFPASEKGWHGLFVETPHGPRFLHPRELAVAQSFPWGFTLLSCHSQAWQFIGNSIPPPMAYLGLLGPAAAFQGWGQTGGGGNWAADGFLRCCRASDGACEALPGGPGPAQQRQSPGRSRSPPRPRARARRAESFLGMSSPRRRTPQVVMLQGRRAREGETPTTIWIDPPSREETRDLLVAFHAVQGGALDVNSFPGAAHREALRIRGLDQPPRQSCVPLPPRIQSLSPAPSFGCAHAAQQCERHGAQPELSRP